MNHPKNTKINNGFTLVELLIVIGIIAVLAAIVFVAIEPGKRFAEARDAQRWSEVNSILNAILKYTVDKKGDLPTNLTAAANDLYYNLGTASIGCTITCKGGLTVEAACLDLSGDLVPNYIAEIPTDPKNGTAAISRYYVRKNAAGRLTIGACEAEGDAITVTR